MLLEVRAPTGQTDRQTDIRPNALLQPHLSVVTIFCKFYVKYNQACCCLLQNHSDISNEVWPEVKSYIMCVMTQMAITFLTSSALLRTLSTWPLVSLFITVLRRF